MKLLIFLFFLITTIKCDLPVHCLAKNIAGKWKFFLSNSYSTFQQCGHEHPDKNTDHIFKDYEVNLKISETSELLLELPNSILSPTDKKNIGTWTMIYDEGFEIRTQNMTFFSFSKYNYKGNKTPQDKDDEETEGYYSLCNETFAGWYHDKNLKSWGCFYGKKSESLQENSIFDDQFLKNPENDHMKIVERKELSDKGSNGPIAENNKQENFNNIMRLYERFEQNEQLYELPHKEYIHNGNSHIDDYAEFEPDFRFIEFINDERVRSPWKAKFHENFMSNKTHRHMKQLLGITPSKKIKYTSFLQTSEKTSFFNPKHKKNLKKNSFKQVSLNENQLPSGPLCGPSNTELPRCLDWRSQLGKNYDTPVKSQGDCGSCYALSTISMIEARIRIKSELKEQPFLSIAGALSCSYYNQGCNGGYPFLIAKEAFEKGFFEESCSPVLSDQRCEEKCFESKVWKVENYGYVGRGFYGSCDEESMMKEIYKNGPVVVAINASPDLYYYSSGVFITNPTKFFQQSNDRNDVNPWIYTNHAVVCVGWGETWHDGKLLKYWILKNSWGSDWGEDGYFKFLKGKNLAAVENQAVFADPIIK